LDRPSVINARKLSTREVNSSIKELISHGKRELLVRNPDARHNLAVGILEPCRITFEGSVGYYCCSFCDGLNAIVNGNSGWGFGDNLMSGKLYLAKTAGASLGASMRDGEIFVAGDAGARLGISMKGGTIIVAGNSGFLTGFMMQKGKIIVLGNVGNAAGDSMYEGVIFAGGKVGSLGADAKIESATPEEEETIGEILKNWGVGKDSKKFSSPSGFKKIVSAKRLYHYDSLEPLEKERLVI
jgi:glutamate synthase domain-containing protein 3